MASVRKVHFTSRGLRLAADLYLPPFAALDTTRAGIVCPVPLTGVKEQTAGLHSRLLAEANFIVLAFDAAYQGESEGLPRGLEDPYQRAEDIRSAVTYLASVPGVDEDRIGAVGICAAGGYVVFTAQSDLRIKAIATVSLIDMGRLIREGLRDSVAAVSPEALLGQLEEAGKARLKEYLGGEAVMLPVIPLDPDNIADGTPVIYQEACKYYRTSRGQHPRSTGAVALRSLEMLSTYDSFAFIRMIRPRPMLMIAGGAADTNYFSTDALKLAGHGELFLVPGRTHVDMYHRVDGHMPKLIEFMNTALAKIPAQQSIPEGGLAAVASAAVGSHTSATTAASAGLVTGTDTNASTSFSGGGGGSRPPTPTPPTPTGPAPPRSPVGLKGSSHRTGHPAPPPPPPALLFSSSSSSSASSSASRALVPPPAPPPPPPSSLKRPAPDPATLIAQRLKMTGHERNRGGRNRTACFECQRRKQKCNKEWPCNHCHTRKVPNLCHFASKKNSESSPGDSTHSSSRLSKKRKDSMADDGESRVDLETRDVDATLKTMSYSNGDDHFGWNVIERTVIAPETSQAAVASALQEAVAVILPRPYTDTLVQNFLNGGNFYYYIIYPPLFSEQYKKWWDDKSAGKPLSLELTCLILRICACSSQYLPPEFRVKILLDTGVKPHLLSDLFHGAAQKLSPLIVPGRGGLTNIQQVFLSAFWYKSESRWTESWHALGGAIREAQELGLHQDARYRGLSEFDKDLRRRTWCLLYVWDWQISLLFGRPLIINHSSCSFELPSLKLDQAPTVGDSPSPYAHMLLQCELIRGISDDFGVIENPLPLETAIQLYKRIEEWVHAFPSVYAVTNTDTSRDVDYPFLPVQRPYLHAISYAMILIPLKPYIIKSIESTAPPELREARSHGVDVALNLMDIAQILFDQVYPNDAKFHFSFFALFDVSALLCAAIMHDKHDTLPRRDDIIEYINIGSEMLEQLMPLTETGATAYKVLRKIISGLSVTDQEAETLGLDRPGKRIKRPTTRSDASPASQADGGPLSLGSALAFSPPTLGSPPSEGSARAAANLDDADITDPDNLFDAALFDPGVDLGALGYIWDWQGLDLGVCPQLPEQPSSEYPRPA